MPHAGQNLDRAVSRSDVGVPARLLTGRTEKEIDDRLRASSRFLHKRAEIESLTRLGFGNGQAVSAFVNRITDTRSGAPATICPDRAQRQQELE